MNLDTLKRKFLHLIGKTQIFELEIHTLGYTPAENILVPAEEHTEKGEKKITVKIPKKPETYEAIGFWSNNMEHFISNVKNLPKVNQVLKLIAPNIKINIKNVSNYYIYPIVWFRLSALNFLKGGQSVSRIFDLSQILDSNFLKGLILAGQIDWDKIPQLIKDLLTLAKPREEEEKEIGKKKVVEEKVRPGLLGILYQLIENQNKIAAPEKEPSVLTTVLEQVYTVKSPFFFAGGSDTELSITGYIYIPGILKIYNPENNDRHYIFLDNLEANSVKEKKDAYYNILRYTYYKYIYEPLAKIALDTKFPNRFSVILKIVRSSDEKIQEKIDDKLYIFSQRYGAVLDGFLSNFSVSLDIDKLSYIPPKTTITFNIKEPNYRVMRYHWIIPTE